MYEVPEKPIDLVLNYIEGMKQDEKKLDIEIERFQKLIVEKLNKKILLEEKIIKWTQVADKFKFKKKV